jgi:hypothetical protein
MRLWDRTWNGSTYRYEVREGWTCLPSQFGKILHRRHLAFQVIHKEIVEYSKCKHSSWPYKRRRIEAMDQELLLLGCSTWTRTVTDPDVMHTC